MTATADSRVRSGAGTLSLVATPLGNLADLSARALEVLRNADLLLAEDTRRSAQLLHACGIERRLESLHEHNERGRIPGVLARLAAGEHVALVSDAGTPLVSDPGAALVAAAIEAGLCVTAVPGPCAAVVALTLSGLPAERFCFEGFLPAKPAARRARLEELRHEPRTLVFYEAPHRIAETLADLAAAFGAERRAGLARELTKRFETVYRDTLAGLSQRERDDSDVARGEITLVVAGCGAAPDAEARADAEAVRILDALLEELPVSRAARLAARLTGRARKPLYELAVARGAGGAGRGDDDTGADGSGPL